MRGQHANVVAGIHHRAVLQPLYACSPRLDGCVLGYLDGFSNCRSKVLRSAINSLFETTRGTDLSTTRKYCTHAKRDLYRESETGPRETAMLERPTTERRRQVVPAMGGEHNNNCNDEPSHTTGKGRKGRSPPTQLHTNATFSTQETRLHSQSKGRRQPILQYHDQGDNTVTLPPTCPTATLEARGRKIFSRPHTGYRRPMGVPSVPLG